jgi:hypothetical protein
MISKNLLPWKVLIDSLLAATGNRYRDQDNEKKKLQLIEGIIKM